jgi:hypothetical protein
MTMAVLAFFVLERELRIERENSREMSQRKKKTGEKGSRLLRLLWFENMGSEGAIKPDAPDVFG